MTSETTYVARVLEPAPGVPLDAVIIHEPVPWGWLFLLTLWFVVAVVVISGIAAAIKRKRKGQSTAGLSIRTLAVAAFALFSGSGVILWSLAAELFGFCSLSLDLKVTLQFSVIAICRSLYGLAINTIVAGVGLVAAIWLKDSEQKVPNQQDQVITGKSGSV